MKNNSIDCSFIDNHVLNTPYSISNNAKMLVNYLIKPAKNEYEKIRAIYIWITANIEYDTEKYFSRHKNYNSSIENVLKNKKGVCAGYSNLFKVLSDYVEIKTVTITGHAKGYSYKPGDEISGNNHDWNAVWFNDNWHLIDATWGSGYISEDKKFIKYFDDFYFFTPPHYFIFNHFPEDTKWQLLPNPITKNVYQNIIKVYSNFFKQKIKPISHKNVKIEMNQKTTILFECANNVIFLAEIKNKYNTILPYCFINKQKNIVRIHISIPKKGKYFLRIYVKINNEDNKSLPCVMEYLLILK